MYQLVSEQFCPLEIEEEPSSLTHIEKDLKKISIVIVMEINKLKQGHPVNDYQKRFEELLMKVDLLEETAMSFFIGGLRLDIQMAVRLFKPSTLTNTVYQAYLQEKYSQKFQEKEEDGFQNNLNQENGQRTLEFYKNEDDEDNDYKIAENDEDDYGQGITEVKQSRDERPAKNDDNEDDCEEDKYDEDDGDRKNDENYGKPNQPIVVLNSPISTPEKASQGTHSEDSIKGILEAMNSTTTMSKAIHKKTEFAILKTPLLMMGDNWEEEASSMQFASIKNFLVAKTEEEKGSTMALLVEENTSGRKYKAKDVCQADFSRHGIGHFDLGKIDLELDGDWGPSGGPALIADEAKLLKKTLIPEAKLDGSASSWSLVW